METENQEATETQAETPEATETESPQAQPSQESEAKPEPPKPETIVVEVPKPIDDEFETVVNRVVQEAQEADEHIGADGKHVRTVKALAELLKNQRKETKKLEEELIADAPNRWWSNFEQRNGVYDAPENVRPKLSRKSLQTQLNTFIKQIKEDGEFGNDARAIEIAAVQELKNHIKKVKGAVPGAVGTEHRTTSGARLTPPGGAGAGKPPKKEESPEEEFARIVSGSYFDPSEK